MVLLWVQTITILNSSFLTMMAQTRLYLTKANQTIYKLLKALYYRLQLKTTNNNNHEKE